MVLVLASSPLVDTFYKVLHGLDASFNMPIGLVVMRGGGGAGDLPLLKEAPEGSGLKLWPIIYVEQSGYCGISEGVSEGINHSLDRSCATQIISSRPTGFHISDNKKLPSSVQEQVSGHMLENTSGLWVGCKGLFRFGW